MNIDGVVMTDSNTVELERLGDEIAELAAHLTAATARLLDLIREFDARRLGPWLPLVRALAHLARGPRARRRARARPRRPRARHLAAASAGSCAR